MSELLLPRGTFSGHPPCIGDVAEADCVIANEFTHRLDETIGGPNAQIAGYLDQHDRLRGLPVFASRVIATALAERNSSVRVAGVFEGSSARGRDENLGTWGETAQALGMMAARGLCRPAIVTAGWNASNVARQHRRQTGNYPIVPEDLPVTSFDWRSQQPWTTCWLAWAVTSPLRIHMLRRAGH